jgi:rhodanese-related sulfurtransferase
VIPHVQTSGLEVAPREVKRLLEERAEFLLLDCREPDEHAIARIGGDTLVPMNDISWRLSELRRHEDRLVVVYCHHGRRSLTVASALRKEGFDHAYSMAGGIDRWSDEIDASVAKY